jgi:hypothetical protein
MIARLHQPTSVFSMCGFVAALCGAYLISSVIKPVASLLNEFPQAFQSLNRLSDSVYVLQAREPAHSGIQPAFMGRRRGGG